MNRRFRLSLSLLLFLLAHSSSTRQLFAYVLEIQNEVGGVALIYPRDPNTHITVEGTNNFVTWWPVRTFDEVTLGNPSDPETIRSHIWDIGSGTFFRLITSSALMVNLAWDPVIDPSVAGYRLYYWKTVWDVRGVDVGNVTEAAIPLPRDLETYHFVVTCYSIAGFETGPSNEVMLAMPAPDQFEG